MLRSFLTTGRTGEKNINKRFLVYIFFSLFKSIISNKKKKPVEYSNEAVHMKRKRINKREKN